jgi:hypothetical protein
LGSAALTVRGVVSLWNPVPFWDMWIGDLGFWYRLAHGGGALAFWEQHNEHRIVLAKVFFWFDLAVWHGSGVFLVASILVTVGLIAGTLVWALRHVIAEEREGRVPVASFIAIASAVTIIQLSWMQWENLVWGFQIQFVLAVLLPLVALVLGARAQAADPGSRRSLGYFIAAAAAAVLSVLTMANGLIAPWLLLALMLVFRASRRRIIVLAALAVVTTAAYAIGYTSPPDHGSPLGELVSHPIDVATYLLSYLGGPWFHATGSAWLGTLAGAVAVVATLGATVTLIRKRPRATMRLALVAFAWFLIGSGVLTALGRALFGPEQGQSSRYQSPVLALWATLLVLAAPALVSVLERHPFPALVALALVGALLIPVQVQARADFRPDQAGRNLATLALSLDVPDDAAIGLIHYDPSGALALAPRLRTDGLTVLAQPPYADAAESVGTALSGTPLTLDCTGAIDSRARVGSSQFDRVSGWVAGTGDVPIGGEVSPAIDGSGNVVGYLSFGFPSSAGPTATGFVGYVREGVDLADLHVTSHAGGCSTALAATG